MESNFTDPQTIGEIPYMQFVAAVCELNANIREFKEILLFIYEGKKKKVDKKKNISISDINQNYKKRNIYTKKKDFGMMVDPELAETLSPEFLSFYEGFAQCYPSVCNMSEPLTYEQYERLCEQFSTKKVNEKIEELENYAHIQRYKSAYRTLVNWLR